MTRHLNTSENGTEDQKTVRGNVSDFESEFWFCIGFSVPLSITALYLCVTQILFCICKVGWRRTCERNRSNHFPKSKRSQSKHAFVINCMSAFAATCAFLRAGVDFRLTFGRYNDFGCDLSIKFKVIAYFLSLLSIYLVLWLRQRIFYDHPTLRHLGSKLIRCVSWTMSVVIVVGVLVPSFVLLFGFGKYLGTPFGCVPQESPFSKIRWIIMIGCTTIFQACLLTLFIYPLVKHTSNVKTKVGARKTKNIIRLVQRAAITSFLCVATDVGFAILVLLMNRKVVTISSFVYDVNIVFNVVCLVVSFPDWRVRLMPWKIPKGEDFEVDQSTTGSTKRRDSNSKSTSSTV